MKATRLRTDSMTNPLGMGNREPRFSWEVQADGFNRRQNAWRLRCTRMPAAEAVPGSGPNAEQGGGSIAGPSGEADARRRAGEVLWDTGKVTGQTQVDVRYEGAPLASRDRVQWQVLLWDESGAEGEWSEPAWFELGLLDANDWKARWIDPQPAEVNPENRYPASVLSRSFTLEKQPAEGRLYITAHGLYRVLVNGRQVTDAVLLPGCTNYHDRLQVQSWDVGELLTAGDNEIQVTLGDGWFRGRVGVNGTRNVYGTRLALLAQLEVSATGGRSVACVTDEGWRASRDGPIRENDLKDGVRADARRALAQWHDVAVRDHGYDQLVGMDAPPVREHEQFTPEVLTTPDGSTVLDFGQNMAGYVSFSVAGERGHSVKLTHGETLDEHGNFTMKNLMLDLGGAEPLRQEVHYTLAGGEREQFTPPFTFHGFRYVLLENWPEPVQPEHFAAHAIYSDLEQIGGFSCSNDLVNQLVHNALWSQKSNFVDIPTDCPQRERAGWTGDIQVFSRTGSYLMDTAAFLRKWLRDLAVQQREDGMVYNITPDAGMTSPILRLLEGSAGWGDAAVVVPWVLWKMYGDRSVLEDQWESMKAWVDYQAGRARKTHWVRWFKPNPYRRYTWDTKYHWGEWLEPDTPLRKATAGIFRRIIFSEPEVATAYFAYSSGLLAEIAGELGRHEEADHYRELAENARNAYRYNFTRKGRIRSDRQCRYVRPVALDLLNDEEKQAAVSELAELVAENDYRIGTGFLTTPYICRTLTDWGHADAAYRMVEQTSIPGWLYPVTKDATTIWETWTGIDEHNVPSASLNHYTYGAVVSWFLDSVVGIRPHPGSPGFAHFVLTPTPDGGLTNAVGSYHSVRGLITSAWKREGGSIRFSFTIPANTTAQVILPCGDPSAVTVHAGEVASNAFARGERGVEATLGSGTYELSCPEAAGRMGAS